MNFLQFQPQVFQERTRLSNQLFSNRSEVDPSTGLTASLYAEDHWKISERITAKPGLRIMGFDTGDDRFYFIEPRFSFSYRPMANLTWTAAWSRMSQYIHVLSTPIAGFPTDLWVPSTSRVQPSRGEVFETGLRYVFDSDWSVGANVFYRDMENLTEYADGANYLDGRGVNWQDKVVQGSGQAYGLEFSLRKLSGPVRLWANYTYSRSFRKFDEINDRERFPARFDRPHDVSLSLHYRTGPMIQFGASWIYASGLPFTLGVYEFDPGQVPGEDPLPPATYTGDRNNWRMPDIHRLDLFASFAKETKWGSHHVRFGIYNAYNHFNPFSVYAVEDAQTRELKLIYTALYPIVPYLTYSLQFNGENKS